MKQHFRIAAKILVDLIALSAAWYLSYAVRWDLPATWSTVKHMAILLPYVALAQFFLLILFDVHLFVWRYVGLKEGLRIMQALALGSLLLLGLRLIGPSHEAAYPILDYLVVPIGVIVIDFAFASMGLIGARLMWRMVQQRTAFGESTPSAAPTVLIGAGSSGAEIAKAIEKNPHVGISAVGFIDDNPQVAGHIIQGLKVLGSTQQLGELAKEHGFTQALITSSPLPRSEVRRIVQQCEDANITAKIIPGFSELVTGQISLNTIRKVEIEDLLGREAVRLDSDAISAQLRGRVILVTGAGGSIGSELCRQIAVFSPQRLLLLERGENNLFNIHRELSAKFPNLEVVPLIADVTDVPRLEEIFAAHRPKIVYHAAAHKHVPMMEWNVAEAIKNNIFGTRNVASASDKHGVQHFVMISTDKAVNPSSVMGTSKRVAEIFLQAYSQRSKTHFVTVRFGNVLGSSGSVVPIFHEQIARGGPVTVTHPDVKRYFMTIPEASQLVLQAGAMGKGGEIFILDMGEPIKIVNLARDMIRLSGLTEGVDIEIKFTGLRPGEKLFEELSVSNENADKTRHSKIFVGRIRAQQWDSVNGQFAQLESAVRDGTEQEMRALLREIVPEYLPTGAEQAVPHTAPNPGVVVQH